MLLQQKNKLPQHHVMEITLRQMDFWYRSALGAGLLEAEQAELDLCLPQYFGRHLLQIGGPSEVFLFEKSPISHKARLTPEYLSVFRGPTIQANLKQLPLLPESIDLVLMPHVLEFHTAPQDVIQQIYQALLPEGCVFILGFNPYSLWGIRRYLGQQKVLPWRGHFWSPARVRHWLEGAGFMIEEQRSLCFRPPLGSRALQKKTLVLEAMGRLFWPNCGGAYLIVGKKMTPSLLPPAEVVLSKCPV
jgi:SAM-dependent methyltransferase